MSATRDGILEVVGYMLLGRDDAFKQQLHWFSLLGRVSGYAKAWQNRRATKAGS